MLNHAKYKSAIAAAIRQYSEDAEGDPENLTLQEYLARWTEGKTEGYEVVNCMPVLLRTLPDWEQWRVLATCVWQDGVSGTDNWVEAYCPAAEFLPETTETLIAQYTPETGLGGCMSAGEAALSLYRSKHPDFIAFVDRYTDEWFITTWLYRP